MYALEPDFTTASAQRRMLSPMSSSVVARCWDSAAWASEPAGYSFRNSAGVGAEPGTGVRDELLGRDMATREEAAFVGVRTHQHGHLGLLPFPKNRQGRRRQHPAVFVRGAGEPRRNQLAGRLRPQLGDGFDAHACGELYARLFGLRQRTTPQEPSEGGAAFADHRPEQSPGQRGRLETTERHRSRRLAENRDLSRISAEVRDVRPNPLERSDVIHQPVVSRGAPVRLLGQLRMGEESEHSQAVVDGHQDHAFLGQFLPVVQRHRAGTVPEASAVDPNHYRQPVGSGFGRRPHVQIEAVFVAPGLLRVGAQRLYAGSAELVRFSHAFPIRDGTGRVPAQAADGRGGIRNTFERVDSGCGRGNPGNCAAVDAYCAIDCGGERHCARHQNEKAIHKTSWIRYKFNPQNPKKCGPLDVPR